METKTRNLVVGVALFGFLLLGGACGAFAGGRGEVVFNHSSAEVGEEGRGIVLEIEEGPEYLHKLRILPLIRVNSPPQLAVWMEDGSGRYLETLYVTNRVARGDWRSAPLDKTPSEDIERPEALPVWSHRAAGADVLSGPTPKESYAIRADLEEANAAVRLFLEVNHSTDFNTAYPEGATPGSGAYSGGPWGSGQPSLVYGAVLDPRRIGQTVEFRLLGHGSPDGSSGELVSDLAGVTSAREILESIRVTTTR